MRTLRTLHKNGNHPSLGCGVRWLIGTTMKHNAYVVAVIHMPAQRWDITDLSGDFDVI